ncbi:MAG: Winged helix DNA-binding protein, partial [Pseudonocardia sp.]|nr:Winged helix DNA-binding protein [Pseudonocardia sp.]
MSAPHVALDVAATFVLGKQGLAGSGHDGVLPAIDSTAGVYGTAPTCYLSCAARVPAFSLGQLDQQLYEQRTLSR